MKFFEVSLILLFCITTALSVIAFKIGFDRIGLSFTVGHFLKWLFNPYIAFGLAMGLLDRFIFFAFLKFNTVGASFLLTMLSIPFTLVALYLVFHEALNYRQIFGSFLIVAGVVLVK